MKFKENVKEAFRVFGKNIQKLREEQNITLKDLSVITGIRKEYLQKIEDGTAYGVLIERHLCKIAKALNKKLYELFDYE